MENVNKPDKIIVHHTASPRDTTTQMDIQEWHQKRNFIMSSLGWYIGYHYVIFGDGEVLKAREDTDEGCHTIGENLRSIGICLTGNFDTEMPSDAQGKALGTLLNTLMEKYGIAPSEIFPHRKFAQKSCYGTKLPDDWAENCALWSEILILEERILELKKRLGLL